MTERTQSSLVSLYMQLKQYDLAKTILQSLDHHQLEDQIATCAIAADLYDQIGKRLRHILL